MASRTSPARALNLRREEILLGLLTLVGALISWIFGSGFTWSSLTPALVALGPAVAGFFVVSRCLLALSRRSEPAAETWLGRDVEFLRGLVFYALALVVWVNLSVRLPIIHRSLGDDIFQDLDTVTGLAALTSWLRSLPAVLSFLGFWQIHALGVLCFLWLVLWFLGERFHLRWSLSAATLTLLLGSLAQVIYPVLGELTLHLDAFAWLRKPEFSDIAGHAVPLVQARLGAAMAAFRETVLDPALVRQAAGHFVLPPAQLAVVSVVAWRCRRWVGLVGFFATVLSWASGLAFGQGYGVHGMAGILAAVAITFMLGRGMDLLSSGSAEAAGAAENAAAEPAAGEDKAEETDEETDDDTEAWWHDPIARRRVLLRILVYPWFFFYLAGLLTAPFRRSAQWKRRGFRLAVYTIDGLFFLGLALPATILVTGELLITANEWVIAEQADYRLQSDFEAGLLDQTLVVPGPQSETPEPVPVEAGEPYYRYLTELYAPVFLQKMSNHPEWDVPLLMDFDGNLDPRDNVENEAKFRPFVSGVYGEVTGITEDSIYLTYSLYHVKDYDHPIREMLSRWTYHDNDNEGLHLRVDRKTGDVAEVEAWFHNRFLLFNGSGESTGTEPVHGRIHVENGTHVIVYAQPQGHGVRLAQLVDRDSLGENVKILRFRGDRDVIRVRADHSVQVDATYELANFDPWYAQALGPFGVDGQGSSLFEETIDLGPELPPIGRFIAGRDYDVNSWSRPKPMWSWDDGWDQIPILIWHFLPDASFRSHGGSDLSSDYLYNRPCDKVFGFPADEVRRRLRLKVEMRGGDKWENLGGRGGELEHRYYWHAISHAFKSYVNYLFHALG